MILRPLVLSVFDFLNKSAFFLTILKRTYITGYCSFIHSTVHTEHGPFLGKVKTGDFGN